MIHRQGHAKHRQEIYVNALPFKFIISSVRLWIREGTSNILSSGKYGDVACEPEETLTVDSSILTRKIQS